MSSNHADKKTESRKKANDPPGKKVQDHQSQNPRAQTMKKKMHEQTTSIAQHMQLRNCPQLSEPKHKRLVGRLSNWTRKNGQRQP